PAIRRLPTPPSSCGAGKSKTDAGTDMTGDPGQCLAHRLLELPRRVDDQHPARRELTGSRRRHAKLQPQRLESSEGLLEIIDRRLVLEWIPDYIAAGREAAHALTQSARQPLEFVGDLERRIDQHQAAPLDGRQQRL